MNFYQYSNNFFYGLDGVKRELNVYVEQIKRNSNLNLLLRAPSGHGKTYMAHIIGNYISYTRKERSYRYYLVYPDFKPETLKLDRQIQVLDEIHLIKNPEFLYNMLDGGNHSFIILTNEYGDIKEPLANRCFQVTFPFYDDEELELIASKYLTEYGISLNPEMIPIIVASGRYMPRDVVLACQRIKFLIQQGELRANDDSIVLDRILTNTFRIYQGGLTELDKRYISFLKSQERASLNTISATTRIPKGIIQNEIEPLLLRRGYIRITPRGREYIF